MSPDLSEGRFWTIYAICLIRRDNKTLNPEESGPGACPAYFRRISANIFSVFSFFRMYMKIAFYACFLKL